MECRVCRNPDAHERHIVREMMFGLRHEFAYIRCEQCGCLQIETLPADLAPYYPDNYYSKTAKLRQATGRFDVASRRASAWLRRYLLNPGGRKRSEIYTWLRLANVGFSSHILDVGCGRGQLLHEFHLDGFRHLTGVDLFIDEDIHYDNGITILKQDLEHTPGQFDLVMMHHSFEHMPDPHSVLRAASARLAPGGCVLIRIPLIPSFAWRHYGTNWFQLDAPRHLFLHTADSLALVAAQADLRIEHVLYDSNPSQFWASEQYVQDIALRSQRSYAENPRKSMFSKRQIRKYARRSRALNKQSDGDAACFLLRRLADSPL